MYSSLVIYLHSAEGIEPVRKIAKEAQYIGISILTPKRRKVWLHGISLISHIHIVRQMEKQADFQKVTDFDIPRTEMLPAGSKSTSH